MKTLNKEQYIALRCAYSQGYCDAHELTNHFDEVIAHWFGIQTEEEDANDDE